MQRVPRPRRPILITIAVTVMLALPAGMVLAIHQFTDVPTGSSIHDDVEAIANAGVTTGCGDGKYCPSDPVTRGQMAQFMNRLGALDGQAPSVNADRVDGRHANQLSRVARMGTAASTDLPTTGEGVQYGTDLVITAPTAGFVTVNFGFTIQSSCTVSCLAVGHVAHVESGSTTLTAFLTEVWASTTVPSTSASINWVFPVDPGVNTFQLILTRDNGGNGTMTGWYGSGTALFTPYGATGGGTLSEDGPMDVEPIDQAKLDE
jgi:hypothetical protein